MEVKTRRKLINLLIKKQKHLSFVLKILQKVKKCNKIKEKKIEKTKGRGKKDRNGETGNQRKIKREWLWE